MRLHALAAVLCAALLAACGGGGTTTVYETIPSSPNAALFQGTYETAYVTASENSGAELFIAAWSRFLADGIGEVGGTMTTNSLGGISVHSPGTGRFAVEADRRFTYESGLPGVDLAVGGITETGDLAAAAIVFANAFPTITLFGRIDGTHDLSSLNGTYRFGGLSCLPAGANTATMWGSVTFDGAGGGTSEQFLNQEGATLGPALLGVGYTVKPDGGVTFQFAASPVLEGSIVAGGDGILLSGGHMPGESPQVLFLVREGAALGDADLDGNYVLVGMTQEVGSNAYRAYAGHFLADGMGTADFVGYANIEGSVGYIPPETVATAVAATGAITMTTGGGDTFAGALAPDGRFGFLAGPTNAASDPTFLLMLR